MQIHLENGERIDIVVPTDRLGTSGSVCIRDIRGRELGHVTIENGVIVVFAGHNPTCGHFVTKTSLDCSICAQKERAPKGP